VSSPRAVLFDVDGTLVNSTYVHTVAWWQAFRRHDVDVPMWRIHRAIGMGADQLVPHVSDAELDIQALAETHDALYSVHPDRWRGSARRCSSRRSRSSEPCTAATS
jgi:beta-phosphoglucomutase-like phosphatase (HAD superfamily)